MLQAIEEYTRIILDKDPRAIVIFLGDHGPARLRESFKSIAEFDAFLKKFNLNGLDVIDDRFRVFAAVHLPPQYKQMEGTFSPANLFAKIFNLIGNEEGVHFEEAPNDMYLLMGTDSVTIR